MSGTAVIAAENQYPGNARLSSVVAGLVESAGRLGYPRVAFLRPGDGSAGPECIACWSGDLPLVCDVVPLFEEFRLRLAEMRPLAVPPGAEGLTMAHLLFATARPGWDDRTAGLVEEAFPEAAHPGLVGDPFTRLVVAARLPWDDVRLLRAAAAYLQQVGLRYSPRYFAKTLEQHPDFVRGLVALFRARQPPAGRV